MSAPSRRPEIRRRRTRKEKILKLRKKLATAGSDSDRAQIAGTGNRQGVSVLFRTYAGSLSFAGSLRFLRSKL
jgi:hypothetical protein